MSVNEHRDPLWDELFQHDIKVESETEVKPFGAKSDWTRINDDIRVKRENDDDERFVALANAMRCGLRANTSTTMV